MPFAFRPDDKSSEKAVRRIAGELLETSRLILDDASLPRETLVHELRKNVKKTRALLRLVRPGFRDFERENAALREAARLIAPLRDADVLTLTFDRAVARTDLPRAETAALRDRLAPASGDAIKPEERLEAHRQALATIAAGIEDWKIRHKGFDSLSGGLERSWDACRRSMRKARDKTGAESLHLFRKRVKDHWYHARLLSPIWPEMMAAHVSACDKLGEALGDARDLANLVETLGTDAFAGDEIAAAIAATAGDEEAKLLAKSWRAGARLFAEPAPALARRWRNWWDVWRG
ncbi:MAG: CHAD domain-containing protein [Proteobacteria bacterium]|nr:CHAD domain-containing protein [Pseudomonadota bacterium]